MPHQFGQCSYIQDLYSKIQEILTSDNIENQLSYFNISFEVSDKNKLKNLVSKAILLLWIFYVFVLSCVCYFFVRVCLYVLCGHLLGKG